MIWRLVARLLGKPPRPPSPPARMSLDAALWQSLEQGYQSVDWAEFGAW